MIKALVVAPYQGLAEVAKSYRNYDKELHIDIKIGNLEEGLQVAKEAETQGYDVIISRGGTASQIEEQVSIPVVDIKISGYDMLRVFTLLKGVQGKAALVGFPNISRGASTICSILDMDVKTITISSREEVTALLAELKAERYSAVIGDVVTVRQAERIGLQGILITSGKEAVMEAFEEAKRLYRLTKRMQAQSVVYAEMIEKFPQPLVTLDAKGHVVLMNHRFRSHLDPSIVEDQYFLDFNDQISKNQQKMWQTVRINEENYLICGYPIDSDKALNQFVVQKQWLDEEQGMKVWTNLSYIPISGESQIARDMRENLKHYAKLADPIWIEGEQGTGRMMFASNLHFETFGHHVPLLSFDLSVASASQVIEFLSAENKQLPDKGTIVLANAQLIDKKEQAVIKGLIETIQEQFRVIILSDESISDLVKKSQYNHELYFKVPQLNVHLPPLRHRLDDIKELVQAFITQNHMKFGYEAVGIREDALDRLIQYKWPGNIDQLKQTVEKLMIISKHSYIELAEVKRVMEDLQRDQTSSDDSIKIEGSLKDMEKKIIEKVMEQEDGNQSKVAEQLKMNRTTLWRRLNS